MIRLLIPVAIFGGGWLLYSLGRVRSIVEVTANHKAMARFLTKLEARDAIVPVVTEDERQKLKDLIDDYHDLPEAEA